MRYRVVHFLALCLFLSFTADAPARAEDAVYWNYGLATVRTGWSFEHNQPIGLKIHLVGVGPDDASPQLEECIVKATQDTAKDSWRPLDLHIRDSSQILEDYAQTNTDFTIADMQKAIRAEVAKTSVMMGAMQIAFEGRVKSCMLKHGVVLPGNELRLGLVLRHCAPFLDTVEPCAKPRDPVGRKVSRGTGRFAKLHEWLSSQDVSLKVNEMVQLVPNGGTPSGISPDLRDRSYLEALSGEETQIYFENGVIRLRQEGWRYDHIAAIAAGIDRTVAMSFIDVIDHPVLVFPFLDNEDKKPIKASNEMARARLRECALFRGEITLSKAAACAGIQATDDNIRKCLDGARCIADFDNKISGVALAVTDWREFPSVSSPFPRIIPNIPGTDYMDKARDCAESSGNELDFARCVATDHLDGNTQNGLDCLDKSNNRSRLDCMLHEFGGEEVQTARCFVNASTAYEQARCLTDLPEEVENLADCMGSSNGDWKLAAGCFGAEQLPGDAGKFLSCGASSGGLAGAAICLAGDQLSPEQRILAQCAMQAVNYAACVGGQLLIKEFNNCRGKNFAEGACFGENNEFRRVSRQLGLGDIGPNSVVAQIVTPHLKAAEAVLSAGEQVIAGIGTALEGFSSGLGRMADTVLKGAGEGVKNACPHWPDCMLPSLLFPNLPEIRLITNDTDLSVSENGEADRQSEDSAGSGPITAATKPTLAKDQPVATIPDISHIAKPIILKAVSQAEALAIGIEIEAR